MRIVMSSGHGKYVRGASGYIDEVDEARKVVNRTAEILNARGTHTDIFHDDVSHSQSENLNRIVNYHNSRERDLDVSVHFNAYETTSKPMGTEVLYVSSTGQQWADEVVDTICSAVGFINRGPKKRTDLAFLNGTEEPAILIETCFVDSKADVDLYHAEFEAVCNSIANALGDGDEEIETPPPVTETSHEAVVKAIAADSAIAQYSWRDRGKAPMGYVKGFALTWAEVVARFHDGDSVVLEMAKGNTHDDAVDALSWYNSNFKALGMTNEYNDIHTLRHLFVLLMGLGMRESSGRHCEGRDMSAENVTADTAEAGLYQTSYNASGSCPEFNEVMGEYQLAQHEGYRDVFAEGVSCNSSSWACYGSTSSSGYKFQMLCKKEPAFAVESCALVLRNLRQHYGPINRKEAELRSEADWMLLDVQRYVESVHDAVG